MTEATEHQHLTPLAAARPHPDDRLPGSGFIALVGVFDHATTVSYTANKPDDNHVFLWVRVPSGAFAGRYETAVNVRSTAGGGTAPDRRNLQYATRDLALAAAKWPAVGASAHAALSYAGMGLTEADFAIEEEGALRSLLMNYAATCARMAVYGVEYTEHTGLHDVHRNAGPKNADGAIAFYFDKAHGGPSVRWIFLKFQSDRLA